MSITRTLKNLEESVATVGSGFEESTSDTPGDRAGYPAGIPIGGATEMDPGETASGLRAGCVRVASDRGAHNDWPTLVSSSDGQSRM